MIIPVFRSLLLTLFVLGTLGEPFALYGQSFFKDGLDPTFHKDRREALRAKMPDNSVAVLFAAPVKTRSNDTEYHYRPNSNFYYLSGLREPGAILIVFKEARQIEGKSVNEVLFLREKDPRSEQWDGERIGVDGAKTILGFSSAHPLKDFQSVITIDFDAFKQIYAPNPYVYDPNSYNRESKALSQKFYESINEKQNARELDKWLTELRLIKSSEEMVFLKKAIEISGYGHMEAMRSIQPGVSERAIQGVFEFIFKVMGAEEVGYGSIVGAGNNTTILHYVDNSKVDIQRGLFLMDVGAEYRGYSGDITRTVPVAGKFSPEEAAIYNIVLEANEAAIAACKPGVGMRDLWNISSKIIDSGLADLGIISKGSRHGYFPHGLGHSLGLDVHDPESRSSLQAGMVYTIEPGIYIPKGSPCDAKWWEIGVRIEDNLLVTSDGCMNLTEFVPKSIQDIEAIMAEEGILQKLQLPGNN
jgi:Xaa-Pro aminopeptidase